MKKITISLLLISSFALGESLVCQKLNSKGKFYFDKLSSQVIQSNGVKYNKFKSESGLDFYSLDKKYNYNYEYLYLILEDSNASARVGAFVSKLKGSFGVFFTCCTASCLE